MPRDLGKAKRSDLSGQFPGEQAEYGSSFARYLEGAGQLKPLEDGTYLDSASDNGNGRSTEIPGVSHAHTDPGNNGSGSNGSSTDTEIGRAPVSDNGASDTVFDTQGGFLDDDAMLPEPAFASEPMQSLTPDTAELEPVEFEPSADTLHPDNDDEPASLDSVPDLTSPELDVSDDDDATDILDRNDRMPAPASSSDTGLLEAEDVPRLREEDRINFAELSADGEETGLPEDLDEVEEKITSKVEPRRDVDPRSQDPNAVVRDTVNFYNQTQNFKEQKSNGGFPTISPDAVNSTQPLEMSRERQDTHPLQREPDSPPELVENEPDLLAPTPLNEPELQATSPDLMPDDGMAALAPVDELLSDEDTDTLKPGPALEAEPAPLDADGDLDDYDKHETDKFRQEDRDPPALPVPEGTDKVDKEQVERERAAGEELQPIADEEVAGGKDTQRFYVADILAKKPKPASEEPKSQHTGDTTSELQPAEEGLPALTPADTATPGSETVAEQTGDPTVDDRPTEISHPLPTPSEVNTDFKTRLVTDASERIVPELESEPDESAEDTVDEEANASELEKITDKLAPPPEYDRTTRRRAVVPPRETEFAGARSDRVKRITDALSQRLKEEREETLRLIEEAEAVAVRLREASESSRADLIALSERRSSVSGNGHARVPEAPVSQPEPEGEPNEVADEFATVVFPEARVSAHSDTNVSVPASRRNPNRVPTRTIGELVDDLQRAAVGTPTPLSEVLAQVSSRAEPVSEDDEDDMDMLVAASARLRQTLEAEYEDDRHSGRIPVVEDTPLSPEPRNQPAPESPTSTLASDLDRLWKVLDSRRTATVVLPQSDKARITRDDRDDADVMEGWTQEMLWPTMAGIAVVTFALGALFVWVLSRM